MTGSNSKTIAFTIYGNSVGKQATKAFYNPKAKKMLHFSRTLRTGSN